MSLVTPDSGLLFWMVIIFGLLFFLLAKFGFPIITSMVEKRDSAIGKSLKDAKAYQQFQFVRTGYFNVDYRDSTEGHPVFNRIVELKSSFRLPKD